MIYITIMRLITFLAVFAMNTATYFCLIAYFIIMAGFFANLDITLFEVLMIALGMTVLSFIVGMSPLSSFIEFLKLPIRELSKSEVKRIAPMRAELAEKYSYNFSKKLRNTVYILDDPEPSATAYAFGRIALNSGLLNKFDDDVVKSVLAHEMGHLHYKDTHYFQSLFALGSLVDILAYGVDVLTKILDFLPSIVSFIPYILTLPVMTILIVRNIILVAVVSLNDFCSKSIEYRADKFSKLLVGKEGLVKFLNIIKLNEKHSSDAALNMYVRSHPPSEFRIERLNS